ALTGIGARRSGTGMPRWSRAAQFLLSRHAVHGHARGRRQLLLDERLHRCRRDRTISLNVFRKESGIAQVVVVVVETVSDTTKSPQAFQPLNDSRLNHVSGAVYFPLVGSRFPQPVQLLVDGLLEPLSGVTG